MRSVSKNEEIWFLSGKRTPFGTFGGALKDLTATDLAVESRQGRARAGQGRPRRRRARRLRQRHADLGRRHLPRAPRRPARGRAVAVAGAHRQPPLRLGLPGDHHRRRADPPRQARGRARRRHRVDVAGAARHPRRALGPPARQGRRSRTTLWTALTDSYTGMPMAITAENLAVQYEITQDAGATSTRCSRSSAWPRRRRRAASTSEIAPSSSRRKKGATVVRARRAPAPETTLEGLAEAAQGLQEGRRGQRRQRLAASATARRRWCWPRASCAEKKGLQAARPARQLGRRRLRPEDHGHRPGAGDPHALERAELKLADVDLFEVNEAFAPQYLAVEKELGLAARTTNVDGGAIALGHPLGASGARITTHLLYELQRRGAQLRHRLRLHRRRPGHRGPGRGAVRTRDERDGGRQEGAGEGQAIAEQRRAERKNRKRKCVLCGVEESDKTRSGAPGRHRPLVQDEPAARVRALPARPRLANLEPSSAQRDEIIYDWNECSRPRPAQPSTCSTRRCATASSRPSVVDP